MESSPIERIHELRGIGNVVRSLVFSPLGSDQHLLASGDYEGNIILWDYEAATPKRTTTLKMPKTAKGNAIKPLSLAYSYDGRQLLTGATDDLVHIWSVSTRSIKQSLSGHAKNVNGVCFLHDDLHAASVSDDTKVLVWDLEEGVCTRALNNHTATVQSIGYADNAPSRFLASGSLDKTVRLWDTRSPSLNSIHTFQHDYGIFALALPSTGEFLLSAGHGGTVNVWDCRMRKLRMEISGHTAEIRCLAVSSNGRLAASGAAGMEDRNVKLWDINSGSQLGSAYPIGNERKQSLRISPDSGYLAVGSERGKFDLMQIRKEYQATFTSTNLVKQPEPSYVTPEALWKMMNIDKPSDPTRDWSGYIQINKNDHLGAGGFGAVYGGEWINIPPDLALQGQRLPLVVVKVLTLAANTTDNEPRSARQNKKAKRELEVWALVDVNHPNIVPFVGIAYGLDPSAKSSDYQIPAFISLRMSRSLEGCSVSALGLDIIDVLSQAAAGVQHLHTNKTQVIHGDIKAANILLDFDNKTIKLSDFGISKILIDSTLWNTTGSQDPQGTLRYMAPELFDVGAKLNSASDVYAFGITTWELIEGKLPLHNVKYHQIIFAVIGGARPERPNGTTDYLWKLMESCWAAEPSKRPSIMELLDKLRVINV